MRLYRGEDADFTLGEDEARTRLEDVFGKTLKFTEVPGLCRAAGIREIEAHGWSLNPGRYVGIAARDNPGGADFTERLHALRTDLGTLNAEARQLENTIMRHLGEMLNE